jgi:hypothetical protein
VGHEGLEPSANGLREQDGTPQSEALRDVASAEGRTDADRDRACFPLSPDDSSRNVTETEAEHTRASIPSTTPQTDAAADVERALVRALGAAAAAGRFDVVAQLARELEARRLTRAGNVVPLDAAKRRKSDA